MKMVTTTEFRRHAANLFAEVENGEVLIVLRHGKPIAEVCPVREEGHEPTWRKPGLRLSATGAGLSAAILEERTREDVL